MILKPFQEFRSRNECHCVKPNCAQDPTQGFARDFVLVYDGESSRASLIMTFIPRILSLFTGTVEKLGRLLSRLAWLRWSDAIRMRFKGAGKD